MLFIFRKLRRAYFLKYIDDFGMTFLILETKIEEIGYTRPIDNIYEKLVRLSIGYLSVL